MVTAGVYLLMRFSPLLEWSSTSLQLIAWLGGLSALLGGAAGLLENDIKRIIAYSTTSQLGYMIVACGLSQYNLGLFHLINHAFFKALLFLSAGITVPAINSAICWEHKLERICQSAGNLMDKALGIFRGHTLKILNIKSLGFGIKEVNYFHTELNNHNNLGSYQAGLIEGDGTINVSKRYRDNNNKIISPQIIISFNSKDLPLALILQKTLNMGQIYKIKGKNANFQRISNMVNLIKVVNQVNGYFRTPKIHQLNRQIDYLNIRADLTLKKSLIDNSPLDSNAWLSGFIEADGHFTIRVSTGLNRSLSRRIACTFELVQRQFDISGESTYPLLSQFSNFLSSRLTETKRKSKFPQYRVRTTSLQGNLILKDYLKKYPLFSSKYLDYLDFLEVLEFFIKKEHYNNIKKIIEIKSRMNNLRTSFNWDHLTAFPKVFLD